MKTLSILITLTLLGFSSFAQTVRRVNLTPGLNDPAIYTSVQAAHDASAAGDVIYIEPTDVNSGQYGSVTVNRLITIIGTGYDLAQTPNTSFDKRSVYIPSIDFENGSAGSKVMGLELSSIAIGDINITVTRCELSSISLNQSSQLIGGLYSNGNNATISNNRFNSSSSISGAGVAGGQATNCVITNNIFQNSYYAISSLSGAVINYNTFRNGNGVSYHVLNNVDGSTFTNNIIDARDATVGYLVADATSNGTTLSNNLCTNVAGLPTGGGNVNSTNPALVFTVANPWTVNPYTDTNIQLAASSPAKTVGPGSTPIGAFAGNNPYVLSGVPNVPVITSFSNTGAGTTATPLSVTISVRSAN